eukprot:1819983-Prymnesium_polylepis.1
MRTGSLKEEGERERWGSGGAALGRGQRAGTKRVVERLYGRPQHAIVVEAREGCCTRYTCFAFSVSSRIVATFPTESPRARMALRGLWPTCGAEAGTRAWTARACVRWRALESGGGVQCAGLRPPADRQASSRARRRCARPRFECTATGLMNE